ncbi:MAG: YaaA family protein [Fusobacteriaceae bacterium]|nr:YaaA family protein [Fusobacteriaceae bacterium]MBP9596623.1 YaaA family protein [Fusobacteriaceae bacterium]
MKIIFSPSKEMNFKGEPNLCNSSDIDLSNKFNEIYKKLVDLSKEEVGKKFKIKELMLDEFMKDLQEFHNLLEKRSIEAYSGLAFRQLKIDEYIQENWNYIQEKVFILSAFYGITCGTCKIKKHRLDFSIKLFEDVSLYKFWSEYVNSFFSENETIINLASSEYSKLIDKKRVDFINIDFYENKELKQISANSKKARGEMLNLLIKNQIENIKVIKTLKLKEYSYNRELSSNNNLVFIKD